MGYWRYSNNGKVLLSTDCKSALAGNYGAPDNTLSDLAAQPHDMAWDAVGNNASPLDFVTNTKALGADWMLSARLTYLGLANLATNPIQSIQCLGLGIGSGILFIPKTIFNQYSIP